MNKKFICIIVAVLLLVPLSSAFSLTGFFKSIFGVTGKVVENARATPLYWKNVDNAVFEKDYLFPLSPATLHFDSLDKYTGWSTLGWFLFGNATYTDLDENNYDREHPAVLSFEHSNFSAGSVSVVYDTDASIGNVLTIFFPEITVETITYPHPTPRLYVSKCGSTYWWDKTHDGWGVHNESLRMNPEEAMIPEHLARASPTCGGVITECTDSDGGMDYFVKGYAIDNQGEKIWDNCIYWDEKNLTGYLEERVCENGIYNTVTYTCPYGCKDGACIKENVTCTDSDSPAPPDAGYIGGVTSPDDHIKGTTTGIREGVNKYEINTDYCFNEDYIIEFYCHSDTGLVSAAQRYCPNGCSDGACKLIPKTTTCVDTDNGKNISVRGTTSSLTYYPRGHIDTCFEQYGGGGGRHLKTCDKNCFVLEGFCVNNDVEIEYMPCPYGCLDGACLKEECSEALFVGTTDFGWPTGSSQIKEINNEIQELSYGDYANKWIRLESSVLGHEGVEIAQIDSAGYSEYLEEGEGVFNLNKVVYANYKDIYGIYNTAGEAQNACVFKCIDSDGGDDKYIKGTLTYSENNWDDSCIDENSVMEYYCLRDRGINHEGTGAWTSWGRNCPNGCSDGACLKAPTTECADMDSGKEYFKKGTVYGIDEEGKEYKNEDSCVDNKLMENYCEMDKPTSEYFTCPEGCENGACIRTCPDITGWRIENGKCVSNSGCDYDALRYVYYPSLEECESHLECVPEWECKVEPPFCPPSGMQTKICKDVACGSEPKQEIIGCAVGQCSGCLHDTTCLPFGQRLKVKDISAYCSIDGVLRPQMPESAECENDYECLSNECSNGECISTYTLLQKIFELLKAIFGKGWLWGG